MPRASTTPHIIPNTPCIGVYCVLVFVYIKDVKLENALQISVGILARYLLCSHDTDN